MFIDQEKFFADPVVRLVNEVGFASAAERMSHAEKKLSQDDVREYIVDLRGKHDFEFFAKNRLFVEDDTKIDGEKVVPFVLNSAQKKIIGAVERQRVARRPIRVLHLKPRQYGASTGFSGYIYRDITSSRNRHATTFSYVLASAEHIRGIAGRFYDKFAGRKPELKGRADKLWKFPELDSTWRIDSAENLQAGHSFTNQILHLSEISRWERDVSALMRGLVSSVAVLPGTMIFIESTANGYGDYFHEMWMKAKSGNSSYEAVFVAWFDVEKYSIPFVDNKSYNGSTRERFESLLTGTEKSLMENFGVSLEQLNWRRWKIDGELNGDEEAFKEQFPATDTEAFLTSGRPYFKASVVHQNLLRTQKITPKTGYLEWDEYGESVRFVEDRDGWWKILREPELEWEFRYVTGTDPSEGKAADESNKDPDYTSITVWDRRTEEDSARFYARVDEDIIADEIHKAGIYYGISACDCIERSSTGIAVINILKNKTNLNLYIRELQAKTEDKETVEYGFQTNQATRDTLLTDLKTRIRLGHYKSDDHEFWKDCSTFVWDKKGKAQAQPGAHDDRVFSAALALQAALQAAELSPIEPPSKQERPAPDADIPRESEDHVAYVEF